MYTQWDDNVYTLKWKDMSFHSVCSALYTTNMWTTVHTLSNGQTLLRHWYIVVINNVTIHVYVIHWDALSHRMSNDIQLHTVILSIQWRNTRDSLRWRWVVHWTRTWVGACEVTNSGNVLIFNGPHSHSTNRAPQWNFTHLSGNPMISVKNTANPCGVRVYRGWNKGIHCHNTAESP